MPNDQRTGAATGQYERPRQRTSSQNKRGASRGSGGFPLIDLIASAASSGTLIEMVDLFNRLGLMDIAIKRAKSQLEQADLDELFDAVIAYFRRNPEVLVVSLGALTVATAIAVWLNDRREWNGEERRAG